MLGCYLLLLLLAARQTCKADESDHDAEVVPIEYKIEADYEIETEVSQEEYDHSDVTSIYDRDSDVIDTDYDATDEVQTYDNRWRDQYARVNSNREDGRPGVRNLIVATLLEPPYMMLRKDSPFLTGNERFEGHLADMLARLSTHLGFTYEIRLARDGKMGGPGENGTWTGLLGEVERHEADMAVGPLTVNEEWQRLVTFTQPFLSFRSTALIRKPKRGGRLRTADDLLYSDLKYGILQGSITQELFSTATNATFRQMWARMATFWPPAFVQSTQEGVERSRRDNFAFILDTPGAEYIAHREPCDFYTIEPFLPVRQYAFIMHKDDEFINTINTGLKRLHEMEEMQLLYLKWWMGECTPRVAKPRSRDDTSNNRKNHKSRSDTPDPWMQATASYQANSSSQLLPTLFSLSGIIYFVIAVSSLSIEVKMF